MNDYYLYYSIESRYENPVRKANFQLLVIPDYTKRQKVADLNYYSCDKLHVGYESENLFGFKTINYHISKPFTKFKFHLSAHVQKPDTNPFTVSPFSPEVEFEQINSLDYYIDHALFRNPTQLTKMPLQSDLLFPEYSKNIQVFDYLIELNNFIYRHLEYSPESTDVKTPVDVVLQIRKGVCQDFAHLFISVCRQNKIAARYVSGYLNQGAGYTGASQLHAWAEVLVPGVGWVGFDATNNLLADHHYIKIAHGTDYSDCSPIIGVLESGGAQKSTHSVIVSNQ
jgi:transglutaminase-like putative cysteine protease